MEGNCLTGQSPQWAVVPIEEEKEESIMQTVSLLTNLHPTHCTLLNPESLRF